jgi:transposase
MSKARMPEEFFDELKPHLPPEQPVGPRGGRPRVRHHAVMRVLWYVLATGCRWEDAPRELGCSGRTAHRRLQEWKEVGVWDRLHVHLLELLRRSGGLEHETAVIDGVIVRAFGGGEATGPSPVDRRKKGSKHTLLVDKRGAPLAIRTVAANVSDHRTILPTLLDYPRVKGKPGRPKELPDKLYADRGYDSEAARHLLTWLGIEPHIARRNTAHGSGLGRVRWVVERTIGWLKGLRRMRVRYDRLKVIQEAWNTLAAAVICFQIAKHDCVI